MGKIENVRFGARVATFGVDGDIYGPYKVPQSVKEPVEGAYSFKNFNLGPRVVIRLIRGSTGCRFVHGSPI